MTIWDWRIQCSIGSSTGTCNHEESTLSIKALVNPANGYIDEQGWFRCNRCGRPGFIVDPISRDRTGEVVPRFKRHLLGIIRPVNFVNRADDPDHPAVFMWSLAPDDPPCGIWIPDLSGPNQGLRPPALTHEGIVDLLKKLIKAGFFDEDKLIDALRWTKPA